MNPVHHSEHEFCSTWISAPQFLTWIHEQVRSGHCCITGCVSLMKSFRRFITTWAGHLELGLHSSPVPTAFPHLLVHCVSQICILLLWPTCAVLSHSVVSDSLRTPGLYPARLLCPWDSPGKNTGVGCHALLQGIFPTPGLNPCFLYLLLWPNGTVIFPQRPNFLDYT